jgi:hypothetical protein
MNRVLLLLITIILGAIIAYNISLSFPEQDRPYSSKDYVEYYDIGCDDSELTTINQTQYKICQNVGEVCKLACENVSAPQVQANIGKSNSVKCRCYRSAD